MLNSGCADYNTAVQIILTVFMILFGVNFNVYFLIYCKKWKEAVHCEEVRAYLGIIAAAVIMISFNICHIFGNIGETVLHAAFQVASIITTTGFASVDFDLWPEFSREILLLLMFIGACAGSTGGGHQGIKDCDYGKVCAERTGLYPSSPECAKSPFRGQNSGT